MDLKRVIGFSASVVLIVLGLIFAIASVEHASRLWVGAIMLACGFGLIYVLMRKEKTIVVEQSIPGRVNVQMLRCPNCSAQLDPSEAKMKAGIPVIVCPYCGTSLELTEEPKW